MTGGLTLITGGARSGKSAYAQQLAASSGCPVLFVATAEAKDEDMRRRIETHRASRPPHWHTLEEPLSVALALRTRFPSSPSPAAAGEGRVRALLGEMRSTHREPQSPLILLDCITLLVSNLLLAGREVAPEIQAMLDWRQRSGAALIAVTNEVGLSIVPDNELARKYRDELGLANQALAQAADSVILMVAGLPVQLKRPA